MPYLTALYYTCVRVTCSCRLYIVGHLLELRCISRDDVTRYSSRDTAMCSIVMTTPGTCCVIVPLSYLGMSRTTHVVHIYFAVKLQSCLLQLLVAKLHTRELSIPRLHAPRMPDWSSHEGLISYCIILWCTFLYALGKVIPDCVLHNSGH